MAAEPVVVPTPDPASPVAADAQPMGDIFRQYSAGQPSDLFAPAYIRGFAPSEQAVANWSAYHHNVTPDMLDSLRMPQEYQGQSPMSGGNQPYGGPIPLHQTYGDPRGALDPEALRSMSQGIHYDVGARRNAIAARLAANSAAQGAASAATAPLPLNTKNANPVFTQADAEALRRLRDDNVNGRFIY